jgi:hypothetical protein
VLNFGSEDDEAIKAGVTLPWSSGPVAGHINRLKMLKRQMCGRARLDLLTCFPHPFFWVYERFLERSLTPHLS